MRLVILVLCCVLAAPAFAKSRGTSFVYLRGGNSSTMMSGDLDDLERVRKAIDARDRALWVRTADGKEYIIRDTASLDELERLWKPANELSQQMGKLGEEQGKLGEQLGKLGEAQGKLGEQQGRLGEKLASANDSQRAAIDREMRELDKQMRELDKQMRVFDKPMRKLDKQMHALEPKQEAAVKEAETGMTALVSRAIANGLAKPF